MNMALIMTAVKQGAVVANHCEVTALHKDGTGKLNGVRVKDHLTGYEWNVRAKASLLSFGGTHHIHPCDLLGHYKRNRPIHRHSAHP
jgi:hypothetical protein